MRPVRGRPSRSLGDLRLLLISRVGARARRRLADARFLAELAWSRRSIDRRRLALPAGGVDAEELASRVALDVHARRADDYFGAAADDASRSKMSAAHMQKPFTDAADAAHYLSAFADLISGMGIERGMRVLDFGCGNGWTSRLLMQLGCEVVLCDVSAAALDIAHEALRLSPPLVDPHQPAPRFLTFDGRTIDLEDGSIDRVLCFDAFHHVANWSDVLAEMHRVLAPNGVAGFHEPGPDHSRTAASQYEMTNFGFLERDIRIGEIRRLADAAGFSDLRLNLAGPVMRDVGIDEFNRFLRWGHLPIRFRRLMWHQTTETRVFYLVKGHGPTLDSRQADGLAARLDVTERSDRGTEDELHCVVNLRNTGPLRWLPSSCAVGGVRLGAHLYDATGAVEDFDFARWDLPGDGLDPGESVAIEISVPSTARGSRLTLDLVSENVTWFSKHGTHPVEI